MASSERKEGMSAEIRFDLGDLGLAVAAVAALIRETAQQEAGPVRERLLQIADAFEED